MEGDARKQQRLRPHQHLAVIKMHIDHLMGKANQRTVSATRHILQGEPKEQSAPQSSQRQSPRRLQQQVRARVGRCNTACYT